MKRKFWIAGVAVVVLAGTIVGSVFLARGSSATETVANLGLPPATAMVTRSTLVETKAVPGTLGFARPIPIDAPQAGTITWIAPAGSTVKRGETLFKIDEQPAVALYGSVPSYRTLRDGAEGADVRQLKENLAELGYTGIAVDDVYTAETADAVRAWQADLGISSRSSLYFGTQGTVGEILVSEGDDVEEGQLLARMNTATTTSLQNALVQASLLAPVAGTVTTINAFVGDPVDMNIAVMEIVTNYQIGGRVGLSETGTVDPNQIVFMPGAVRIAAHSAHIGEAVRGGPLLSYTDTVRLVTVELNVIDQALAVEGRNVVVTIPGREAVEGEISKVGTVVKTSNGSSAFIEVTVTIADQKALGALSAAPVDVDFISDEREDVLTVPIAALLALAEGGYGVEIVDGNTTRISAITTGMFAAGRVEVSGGGISEGATVGMPK
ncbi:MAG: biotin/lipoyl-binding protein [Chloroflexi bacterium]|nr:biotin/lipoyl-binding protein [Chloroflexota bacterium]